MQLDSTYNYCMIQFDLILSSISFHRLNTDYADLTLPVQLERIEMLISSTRLVS